MAQDRKKKEKYEDEWMVLFWVVRVAFWGKNIRTNHNAEIQNNLYFGKWMDLNDL